MLSREEIEEIEHEAASMPRRKSACIEALRTVQRHRGWVCDEAIADVAEYLDMSRDEVDGVATFYNLIFRHPVGRHVIFLCDSVSCWVLGCDRVRRSLSEKLGVDFGGTTEDGRFTLLPIQCLGTCDHAPALMVDDDLHRDVAAESVEEILNRYE
ncbi:MAG TPA: NADH-quinone oxidoreductase subunit NuoE [Thermoanaerobaculia bacterium]|jgi:NADH-quinone oxidoreductase subunit E